MSYLGLTFIGPGPRDDGRIYIADYGVTVYPQNAIGNVDSSVQVQNALTDAGQVKTTVIWPAGVIRFANIAVPQGIINIGCGRDYNGNWGTTLVSTSVANSACFILAQGGPFEFRDMTLKSALYGIHLPGTLNSLTLNNVGIGVGVSTGAAVQFDSTSNYPLFVRHCSLSGGSYGIYASSHLGSAVIEDSVFGAHLLAGVQIDSKQPAVSSQGITISRCIFNGLKGPNLEVNTNATHIIIEQMSSECQPAPGRKADLVFGPYSQGHLAVSDSDLGINNPYSIYNAPGFTLLQNCGFGHSPVYATDVSKVIATACTGPTPLVVTTP